MPLNTKLVLFLAVTTCVACRGSLDNADSADVGSANIGAGDASNATPGNNVTPGNNLTPGNNVSPNNSSPNNRADGGARDMATGEDVSEPPFDAGACGNSGFGDEFSVVGVAGTAAQGRIHAVATSGGGAVLAWRDAGGVHVTHVDGAGGVVKDSVVPGDELYGLAAHDGGRAVMVSRGSDILALVILDGNGTPVSDQTIIGDVDHDVTENEWFGSLIRVGAMTWTGTQWATYYAVQRLWNDGVAHYGDQLRLFEPDGSANSVVWGWGCSHSMEVKISHNGDRLGPVCSSDCFPSKGVHFNHRSGQLWPDEGGSNCAGQYGTSLGASVPIPGGFWLAFTATDNRQSHDVAIARVDGNAPGTPIWLTTDATDDRDLRSTNFEQDLVVAWTAGGQNQFSLVSGVDGSAISGPVNIGGAELGGSSDFFTYANGDIGWAQREAGMVGLARLKACR